jgi:hypothetical protein
LCHPDIPADLAEQAAEYRQLLIDTVVELDDAVCCGFVNSRQQWGRHMPAAQQHEQEGLKGKGAIGQSLRRPLLCY